MAQDTRVLLVDDDPLVRKIYQEGLKREGFDVETAEDGLSATQVLQTNPPEALVLDLMMPKFGGVDVLRFMGSRPELRDLPVVVLSNSYLDDLVRQVAGPGMQKALLKIRCTPALLAAALREVLGGVPSSADPSALLPAGTPQPENPRTPAKSNISPPRPGATAEEMEFFERARADFLANAPLVYRELEGLEESLQNSRNDVERELRLQNLYRKIHFTAATAGLAGCHQIAQLASAFEALLYSLIGKPSLATESIRQTIAQTITLLGSLFRRAGQSENGEPHAQPRVLVVDDNPVNGRLMVNSLRQVGLSARSTESPLAALHLLSQHPFDLVLLDIEMPGMDGYEVCRQLRALEGYEKIPVIFVTSHSDFGSRAKGVLSGGNDLIAKPIFPMELALKAVAHLIRLGLRN